MKTGSNDAYVLLVEDNPDIRESLVTLLGMHGFRALATSSGAEALSRLKRGPQPFLILLDLTLPDMDGFGFREEQLRVPGCASIPVAVISGDSTGGEQATGLGIDEFLRKPVDPDELVRLVASHAERTASGD